VFRALRTEKTLRAVWWLVVGGYALAAVAPFNFSAQAQTFHWLPFTGVLESDVQNGFFSLTGKVFVYLGLLWVATKAGSTLAGATVELFAIALVLELVQIFLPGRAAEFSDPMLVVLPAVVMAAAQRHRAAVKRPSSDTPA
jgi:VanZ family protein